MKYSQKVMAAIFAGTMAMGALAPITALAATKTTGGSSQMTITKPNVADGGTVEVPTDPTKPEGPKETKQVKVTVPTTIPLAADASGAITGPTSAGFTNTGQVDLKLSKVKATMGAGFTAVDATDKTTTDGVYVKIDRASDATDTFTLKDIAGTERDISSLDWNLTANSEDADVISINSGSKIINVSKDLSTAKTLATIDWTFDTGIEVAE